MLLLLYLLFSVLVGLAVGQGCGNIWPAPVTFPPLFPPITPQPCYFTTPAPLPVTDCRGCPVQQQLPNLVPVPRVYPETPPGEYITHPDPILIRDTKVIRHDLDENSNSTEKLDEPIYNSNSSSPYVYPISPQHANYRQNYYTPYYPSPQPQNTLGCGWALPPPMPLPTPPPLVLPAPAPLPLIPPLNTCCGRCNQCGGYSPSPLPQYSSYYTSNPKIRFSRNQKVTSRCTNFRLKDIMEKAIFFID